MAWSVLFVVDKVYIIDVVVVEPYFYAGIGVCFVVIIGKASFFD